MDIKERIKRSRKADGLTQEKMARSLGISVNSYREIESGKTNLISPKLFKISEILKIPAEKLILGHLTGEEYLKEINNLKTQHKRELDNLKSQLKIVVMELKGEINILEANLETKESIIGVLKEESQRKY